VGPWFRRQAGNSLDRLPRKRSWENTQIDLARGRFVDTLCKWVRGWAFPPAGAFRLRCVHILWSSFSPDDLGVSTMAPPVPGPESSSNSSVISSQQPATTGNGNGSSKPPVPPRKVAKATAVPKAKSPPPPKAAQHAGACAGADHSGPDGHPVGKHVPSGP